MVACLHACGRVGVWACGRVGMVCTSRALLNCASLTVEGVVMAAVSSRAPRTAWWWRYASALIINVIMFVYLCVHAACAITRSRKLQ